MSVIQLNYQCACDVIIYPLPANHTHATNPYSIGIPSNNQLRKNNAVTFRINKSAKLRIPIPTGTQRTGRGQ